MNIELVSWNAQGLLDDALDERSEGLIFHALFGMSAEQAAQAEGEIAMPPDFILLQEVVDRSLNAHFLPHLQAIGYDVFPLKSSDTRDYYELIAVRPPWKVEVKKCLTFQDTEMGRELLTVEAVWGQQKLKVMTAHMESLKSGGQGRLSQLAEIGSEFICEADAIFMGDTNLRKAEWESMRDVFPALDVFEMMGSPKDQRATWFNDTNTRSARYDRAWISKSGNLKPTRFEVSKCAGLSDHAGMRVTLSCPE